MADIIEKDDVQQDEELVIVEDESQLTPTEEHEEEEDDRLQAQEEDDENDEREAIRERRRQEKKDRKERKDQAIKRDKLELDFLRKRNDDLERRVALQEERSHQSDLSAFDAAIAQANREATMAEQVIAKAVEAGNGEDVTKAMRYRDQAFARMQQLSFQKQQAQQTAPQRQSYQIDDATMQHAKAFMNENPWYDVHGGNEDSAIVIAIDQSLSKEGYDPKSEEYWSELRKRAAKRLPEHFASSQSRTPRGGPAVGSGKEHAPASTRKEIYINPERKQALIDAGVWDDPVLRAKYVKRYAEYDRQNKS